MPTCQHLVLAKTSRKVKYFRLTNFEAHRCTQSLAKADDEGG
jgi:hypothetical protein